MKAVYLFAAVLLAMCVLVSSASAVEEMWFDYYVGPSGADVYARDIAVDSSGNILVVGTSEWSGTGSDITTIKYDPAGNVLWVKQYAGPYGEDSGEEVEIDADDNIIVAGETDGAGGTRNFVTIKYAPDGTLLWYDLYDGPEFPDTDLDGMGVDALGNVYVAGDSGTETLPGYFIMIKYDANGNQLWLKAYGSPLGHDERARDLKVDETGNYVVTGYSRDAGVNEFALTAMFDSDGDVLWSAIYDAFTGDENERGEEVDFADAGSVVVTGHSFGAVTNEDIFTVKYDTDGTELWSMRYNGSDDGQERVEGIAVDSAYNVIVAGSSCGNVTGCDYVTIKYDPDGAPLWDVLFSGPGIFGDEISGLCLDSDDNVIVTGSVYNDVSRNDITTIKYDPDGNELWTMVHDGPAGGYDEGKQVIADDLDDVIVLGLVDGESSIATIKYSICQGCTVDGACEDAGTLHPTNACLWCDPVADRYGWSSNDGAACDDGIDCSVDECLDGVCVGTPNDALCDDGVFCTSEFCDMASGACIYVPDNSVCDDGVSCTVDYCDAISDCQNIASDNLCSDGDFCNGAEVCDEALGCQGGTAPCGDDGLFCNGTESCDEAGDTCLHSGDPCPAEETCDESADICVEDPTVCGMATGGGDDGLIPLMALLLALAVGMVRRRSAQ